MDKYIEKAKEHRRIFMLLLTNHLRYAEDITEMNIEEFLMNISNETEYVVYELRTKRLFDYENLDYELIGIYKFKGHIYSIYYSLADNENEIVIECRQEDHIKVDYYITVEFIDEIYNEDYGEVIDVYNEFTSNDNYICCIDEELDYIEEDYEGNEISYEIGELIKKNIQDKSLSYKLESYIEKMYPNFIFSHIKSNDEDYEDKLDELQLHCYTDYFRYKHRCSIYTCNDNKIASHGGMYINIYQDTHGSDQLIVEMQYGYKGYIEKEYYVYSQYDIRMTFEERINSED